MKGQFIVCSLTQDLGNGAIERLPMDNHKYQVEQTPLYYHGYHCISMTLDRSTPTLPHEQER